MKKDTLIILRFIMFCAKTIIYAHYKQGFSEALSDIRRIEDRLLVIEVENFPIKDE